MKRKFKYLILVIIFMLVAVFSTTKVSAATVSIKAGIVATDGANLNVRSKPSTSGTILTRLGSDSYVSLVSKNGSWWYVEYADGRYGYVSSDYIDVVNNSYNQIVNTNGTRLNVRSGPSIYSSRIDTLEDRENVIVLSYSNSYSKVLYDGVKIGYAYTSYLSSLNGNNNSNYKYNKISLSVASYKQFDSRWASVPIGYYGGTMKTIGCTTTSLAMTESYRTHSTITPTSMKYRLSYTSDGSLYWPSNYVNYYSNDYLSKLYSLLSEGKPAIISFKKASGGLHFVVVTGYNANTNYLSASNFTINDPGSSYRTTLNQLIAAYPTYNKINYYK